MIARLLLPLKSYKYLWYQLTQKEVKARYKQSILGVLWVVINPLVQLLVFTFIFTKVFRFNTDPIPYPLFLFSGLLAWTLFQNSLLSATRVLVDNATLLTKVVFPREVIVYATVGAKLVDLGFGLLVFFAFLLFYLFLPGFNMLWLVPVILIQLLLTVGIGLMLSTFNLFYRDFQHMVGLLLMVWMYLSPVFYPMEMVPQGYLKWYSLNPLVGILNGYRHALLASPLNLNALAFSGIVSVVVFVFGFLVFKKYERVFADVV